MHFLVHLVNHKGILLDLAKIEAVMQWEVPISPSEIQIFLGLGGYYQIFNFVDQVDKEVCYFPLGA